MAKVFGVGLSRTGTKSLTAALSLLGYKAGHYDVASRALTLGEDGPGLDEDVIRAWDALADIPIAAMYRTIDERFRGSKFILTVRAKADWLDSCERHYAADRSDYVRRHGIEMERILAIRALVYGRSVFSRDAFGAVYDRHRAEVLAHFRDRGSDLLVLDICAGAGWPDLCGFLDEPVPAAPFPRENASRGAR